MNATSYNDVMSWDSSAFPSAHGLIALLRNNQTKALVSQLRYELKGTEHEIPSRRQYGDRTSTHLILPLLFSGQHRSASAALLEDRELMAELREVRHDKWLLELAKYDPQAWVWALEQGWGSVIRSSPASLGPRALGLLYERTLPVLISGVYGENTTLASSEWQKGRDQPIARPPDAKSCAWDSWVRSSSKKPQRVWYLVEPTRQELELAVSTFDTQWETLPADFWGVLRIREPHLYERVAQIKQLTVSMGLNWSEQAAVHALAEGLAQYNDTPLLVPNGIGLG